MFQPRCLERSGATRNPTAVGTRRLIANQFSPVYPDDDDIAMPDGPPPGMEEEGDDVDDIPMPDGPPPGQPSEGMIPQPFPGARFRSDDISRPDFPCSPVTHLCPLADKQPSAAAASSPGFHRWTYTCVSPPAASVPRILPCWYSTARYAIPTPTPGILSSA